MDGGVKSVGLDNLAQNHEGSNDFFETFSYGHEQVDSPEADSNK